MTLISHYKVMAWALNLDLPQTQKLVLLVLCHYADKEHVCYPGQDLLAKNTGLGVRTVRRALSELENAEIIHRDKRFRSDGIRTSDQYFLNVGHTPK